MEAPLKNADCVEDILSYPFPRANEFDFSVLRQEAEENRSRVKVGGLWTGIMGDSYRMYGFERFLMDLIAEPEMIHALVDKLSDVYLALNNRYFEAVKGDLDVWFFGNDFGSQMGLLMREEMWCEYFYENIKTMCDLAHSYGISVMMHSCGGIAPIIPHLIRAGVDMLDPIQTTAKGMEPQALQEKYGGKIIFHGGLDTQNILPRGTVEQVRAQAQYLKETFREGGYVFASSQVIDNDVPVENVLAMYGL